ncbi:hypothetical protein V6615_06580 [Oscillospiraceae bacterium PP1C4]
MCQIRKFVNWGMEQWKLFTVCDVALFKVCLFSFGALIGVYCTKPLKKLAPLLWFVAAGSFIYLVWRMMFCNEDA